MTHQTDACDHSATAQQCRVTVHTWGNTRAWEQEHLAFAGTTKAGRPSSQEKCEHVLAQETLDITPALTVH